MCYHPHPLPVVIFLQRALPYTTVEARSASLPLKSTVTRMDGFF